MRRSYRNASVGFVIVFVLNSFAVLGLGCGASGATGFLGLETCEILNCEGLFFSDLAVEADGHDSDEGTDDAAVEDGHDEVPDGEEMAIGDVVEEAGAP